MGTSNIILRDLSYIYPEIILTVFILVVLVIDLIPKLSKMSLTPYVSFAGLILTMVFALSQIGTADKTVFYNMLVIDQFSVFFRIFLPLSSAIIVILSMVTFKKSGEYYTLILATTLGMVLMTSSIHIASIILSLELVGICCYVLAGYRRSEMRASEASLKYMLYGAVSTGIMLFGFSYLYGLTGQVNLYSIRGVLLTGLFQNSTLFVAVLFILAGIGYKIAMVPFHFWCPDVYEGAPTPITTFFSVGPKVAGIALLARFLFGGLSSQVDKGGLFWMPAGDIELPFLIAVLSAITMTVGNLAALGQKNIKRLLAYSSIAHAGYIMMGFAMFNGQGMNAILFYVIVYMFMNFGAFIVVDGIALKLKSENIDKYNGLASRAPYMAFAMTVFLVSLTGLPPTAGFIGKMLIFAAVIESKIYWLVIIGALNAVVSLYYYFRIAKAMYLTENTSGDTSAVNVSKIHFALVTILLIPTVYFGLFWTPLREWTTFGINFLITLK
ncbi:NADH-quinone oxidoreductase subunit N [candidate division KSB1 bacterium]